MRLLVAGLLLLAGCAGRQAPAVHEEACGMDVRRLLTDELALRPLAQPQDLYKLVHQAVLGPGHALTDPAAARQRLEEELALVGPPLEGEAIVEDLDESVGTVRVNLRKWRFIRGSASELWPVFAESAAEIPPDPVRLRACLAGAAAALDGLGYDSGPFRGYVEERAGEGFPSARHSAKYRKLYQPAYRVVLRRLLPSWVTAPPPTTG